VCGSGGGYFSKERTRPDPEPHKIQNQINKDQTCFKINSGMKKFANKNSSKKVKP
jgi:hypothetical protein